MIKYLTLPLLLAFAFQAQCQSANRTFESSSGRVNILGEATLARLQEEPFKEWFEKSHSEYQVDTAVLDQLLVPDSITIFMGTWCGDSRKEVPRFVKMLELINYDFNKLKIICLNTGFQNYKQAPERQEAGMNIHRVPTFVFHDQDQQEIGRIVEEPVVSLEQDMNKIMQGKPYETSYPVAHNLIEQFQNHTLKELDKKTPHLLEKYRKISVSEYELNTYGYVLWAAFDLMKAEFVFELNSKLYPESIIAYSSLARFKENLGKKKEAISSLKKGLALEPENERLLSLKASLEGMP